MGESKSERKRARKRERVGVCRSLLSDFFSKSCVGCAAMECHGDRLLGRKTCTGRRRCDVVYREALEGLSPDCGMPGDGVSFQKNAGYTEIQTPSREGWSKRHRGACLRHGVTDDLFPRQVMGSNALMFSLGQSKAGFLVKSMRLIPTNMVGQTCETGGACGSHAKRVMTKRRKTVTLNEEQGEVLPWRRTRRRLRCGSTSSRIRCHLVMLALMLHELDVGTQ